MGSNIANKSSTASTCSPRDDTAIQSWNFSVSFTSTANLQPFTVAWPSAHSDLPFWASWPLLTKLVYWTFFCEGFGSFRPPSTCTTSADNKHFIVYFLCDNATEQFDYMCSRLQSYTSIYTSHIVPLVIFPIFADFKVFSGGDIYIIIYYTYHQLQPVRLPEFIHVIYSAPF